MKCILKIFTFFILFNCNDYNKSNKLIPENFEIYLKENDEFYNYRLLLSKSIKNDTTALLKLMKINNICGGEYAFEHGYIFLKIVEIIGDNQFSKNYKHLNENEKKNLNDYLIMGIDRLPNSDSIMKLYPKTYVMGYRR